MKTIMNEKKEKVRQTNEAGLYLVATPIGNLGDITRRALEIIEASSLIVCEDTRVTGRLLKAFGIKPARLLAYNDHNADARRPEILAALDGGQMVAMVSDAGMPLISDPGYKLVRDCIEHNYNITSAPGANAPLMALQLSGLPSDKFSFIGFLPAKKKARLDILQEWSDVPGSLIFFESAPRLAESLEAMLEVLGNRQSAIARELTKLFEEVRRGTLEELLDHYRQAGPPKGEIVIVIGPPDRQKMDTNWEEELQKALEDMSVRDAAALISRQTGIPKKRVYEEALKLAGNK